MYSVRVVSDLLLFLVAIVPVNPLHVARITTAVEMNMSLEVLIDISAALYKQRTASLRRPTIGLGLRRGLGTVQEHCDYRRQFGKTTVRHRTSLLAPL